MGSRTRPSFVHQFHFAGFGVASLVAFFTLVTSLPAPAQDLQLRYAAGLGGADTDSSSSIAIDGIGNAYTTGTFQGTADFDPGTGTLTHTSAGLDDIFVHKLNSSGGLAWVAVMGGADFDRGEDVAADSAGNVYTTGAFVGTVDFDPGAGTLNLTGPGGNDGIFIQKLDTNGALVWARAMQGTGFGTGRSIALDPSGNVYTAGQLQGTVDFDPGAGVFELSQTGEDGIFIQKMNASGELVWARAIGGANLSDALGIAPDDAGNVYVTGSFRGTIDFDPGAGTQDLTSAGNNDIFVLKLDTSGNFDWAVSMGGTGSDIGHRIDIDGVGGLYIAGEFRELNPGRPAKSM